MLPAWNNPTSKKRAEIAFAKGVSCRAIAAQFSGASRNAVAGHVHRRGIVSPNSPRIKKGARLRRGKSARRGEPSAPSGTKTTLGTASGRRPNQSPRHKKLPKLAPEITNPGAGVGVLDLQRGQCRWPISGTESETRFCGQRIFEDERQKLPSWCLAHQHLGLTRAEKLVPKQFSRLEPQDREDSNAG